MSTPKPEPVDLSNPQDSDYINAMTDSSEKEAAVCSLVKHRQPDRVKVGDTIASINVVSIDDLKVTTLDFSDTRPSVLLFGSYT